MALITTKIMKYGLVLLLLGFGCIWAFALTDDDKTSEKTNDPQVEKNVPADWAFFRGDAQATGVVKGQLSEKLDLLWTFTIEKGGFESTAAIVGDTVYVGGTGGKFYTLNLSDGKKRWEFPSALGFTASPAVRDGLVYIGDSDGNFYCLDAKTGEKKWSFQADGEINSSANFYKHYILFGSQDSMLYCLDAKSGNLAWKYEGGDQIRCFPTVLEHYAFIAGCDAALTMIDLDDGGKIVSKVPLDSPTGCTPAVMDSRVFVGTEGGTFFCIEPKGKKILWQLAAEKNGAAFRSSAAVSKEATIVGSRDKRVYAFNPQTGKLLWNFPTKSRVDSSPVIVGNRVIVGSADGRIYALNIKTGERVWQFEAGGAVLASPAIGGGRLVIGNNRGEIFCFGEK
jgi:outer membrane protein assembly factor BamB